MSRFLPLLPVLLLACTPFSETVGAAAPLGTRWQLETVGDAPAAAPLTLVFLANGGVQGTGPCNTYAARQTAPLPWFELADLTVTERACDALAQERRLLALLARMTFAEASDSGLLLTNGAGESLYFTTAMPSA